MIVPVQVEPPRRAGPTIDSYLGYLEPEVRDNMGLVVARTVAPVKNGCTVARLLNPTNQELKLRPGSHLGVFHHVNECDIITPADVFDSQQVEAPLPECPLSDDQRQQLQVLLRKHQGVFNPARGGTGNPNLIKHHIQTGDHPPIKQRAYRTSPDKRREIAAFWRMASSRRAAALGPLLWFSSGRRTIHGGFVWIKGASML